jgi:hypothetical protein
MIAKVTKRTELGPLRALPMARQARIERGNVNDCEVDGVLRRHSVLAAHSPEYRAGKHQTDRIERRHAA